MDAYGEYGRSCSGQQVNLVGPAGFEPASFGLRVRCITSLPQPRGEFLVGPEGFEPSMSFRLPD